MYNSKGDLVLELKDGNGKGKEYGFWNNIIYEGNYIDGTKEGKIIEYNGGKKIYEGDYEHGKRHGNGKEYNKFGNLIFEGNYKNGNKWDGKLIEYYKDKLLFEAGYYCRYYLNSLKIEISIKDSESIFNLSSKEYYDWLL